MDLRSPKIAMAVFAFGALSVGVDHASAATAKKTAPTTPAVVASFGEWGVYVGAVGKGKICYLLNQPKAPANSKRDKVYAFISDRPAEGVRNEVSFIMGAEIAGEPAPAVAKAGDKAKVDPVADKKKAAIPTPVAVVGDQSFDMLAKGSDLWIKNPATEPALIDAMRKGAAIVVKATLKKGGAVADTYSLTGFNQAADRLNKECPGK